MNFSLPPCLRSLAFAALVTPLSAATLTVGPSGADFTSLQAAIIAASPGDTIDILGRVTEQGIVISKDVNLTSSQPTPQIVQAATEPGAATDRVFYIAPSHVVSMENLIIRHGATAQSGGGIVNFGNLTLNRVTIEKNQAAYGGGIFNQTSQSLTVTESTLRSNVATDGGGAIYSDTGTVLVERSTLAKNRAFEGGGIKNRLTSNLTVNNSTISMNLSPNGGAGIFNQEGASVSLNSSTLAHNSLRAVQNNGSTSSFEIQNCILADSLTSSYLPGGADCAVFLGGVITDLGHNIVENPGSCVFAGPGSITGVDPILSALANYGGPTRTHAILYTSPALQSGDAGALTVDQRNVSRPQSAADDVGAFESKSTGEYIRPSSLCAPVVANGEIHFVEFHAQDHRSPNFEVLIQNASGGMDAISPDFYSHGTYLGEVEGMPGAIAGATYFPSTGELYYHVIFADGKQWSNEGGTTVVRGDSPLTATSWPGIVPEAGGAGSGLLAAEIGVDLPNDRYVAKHGSDANDAVAMIEHSFMAANLVYMRQAGIQNRIERVIIRGAAGQDPYASISSHNEYLAELKNQWDNVLPASTHDLALVVRAEASAGLASVGSVGTPGYSSNDATSRGDFSGVWRHEVGHNWFLSHYDGGAPEGSTLNSGNAIGRLSGPEQALMTWFRNTKTGVLENLGVASVPIPPSAATDRAFVSAGNSETLIDLLHNDHDANGDALTLLSIDSTSELSLGGTMELSATPGLVKYTLPAVAGPTSAIDRFRYRIRDASGQEAEGFVFVRLMDFSPTGEYAQNFDAFADGTTDLGDGSYMTTVSGTTPVKVLNQALQLTPDATGQHGGFTVPALGLDGGYQASFRYRITSAGSPADGFAVNLGAPNSTRIRQGAINVFPDGLTVEWHTYSSRGYNVYVDNVLVTGGYVSNSGLADGLWHDVVLLWHPQLGLSLTVDETPIFTNLEVPGFSPEPDALLAFAGLTVGLSEEVLIDDLVVASDLSTLDRDADGISAFYEAANGLDDLDASDTDSDHDGDGFNALFESIVGTLAGDPSSKPIWQIEHTAPEEVQLTYGPLTPGVTYEVRSSINGTDFTPFDTFSPASSAPSNSLSDPTTGANAKIYRLKVTAPE